MMKKAAALMLVLVFCFSVISCRSAAGTSSASSDPSWSKITEKKQLTVGVLSNHQPLTYQDADSFAGFDIDLMTQIATRLNLTVQFVPIDGKAASDVLSSGAVDCVCSGFVYSAEQNETLTLSESYLTSRQVFTVPTGSGVKNLADLAGKKLGVASGSTAQTALSSAETFRSALGEVKEYNTEDDVMKALLNGEIDSAAVSEMTVRHSIATGSDLRTLLDEDNNPDTLETEQYVLAFSRGSSSLQQKVQDAMF